MNERDRSEKERLQEIRQRALAVRERSEGDRAPEEERVRSGPVVSAWRSVGRLAGRDYPAHAAHPGMMAGDPREAWSPRAQVFDREGAMVVRFELPGLESKDVAVEVEDQMLVVEGERHDDRPVEGRGVRRSGWGYGRFRREVALPHPVDASDVSARFRNGVLEVVVPVPRREVRRKEVTIEA
jgi:HSP20 family protein